MASRNGSALRTDARIGRNRCLCSEHGFISRLSYATHARSSMVCNICRLFGRLAPLSQGRVDPSDSSLMCSYHGWRFNGEGQAVSIPQAHFQSPEVEMAARKSDRSCVKSFPTQVCAKHSGNHRQQWCLVSYWVVFTMPHSNPQTFRLVRAAVACCPMRIACLSLSSC